MTQQDLFKQLERRAYLLHHEDGLVDLIIGWATLAFGLLMATGSAVWMVFTWLPFILYVPLKNRVTVPRLGYAKFDSPRGGVGKSVMRFLILAGLVLVLLGLAVSLLWDRPSPSALLWIRENPQLFFGLVGAVGFGMGGWISGIRRLYAYGALSLLLLGGSGLLGLPQALGLLILGGVVLLAGLALLVQFLRRNPIVSEAALDETR